MEVVDSTRLILFYTILYKSLISRRDTESKRWCEFSKVAFSAEKSTYLLVVASTLKWRRAVFFLEVYCTVHMLTLVKEDFSERQIFCNLFANVQKDPTSILWYWQKGGWKVTKVLQQWLKWYIFSPCENNCSCGVDQKQTGYVQQTCTKWWLSCHFRVQVFNDSLNGSYGL